MGAAKATNTKTNNKKEQKIREDRKPADKPQAAPSGAEGRKQEPGRKDSLKNEIIGIVMIAAAGVIGLSVYTQSQALLLAAIRGAAFGLMGLAAYALPPVLAALGITVIMWERFTLHTGKALLTCLGVLSVVAMVHMPFHRDFGGTDFGAYMENVWQLNRSGALGTGVMGGAVCWPLVSAVDVVGAWIVLAALLLIAVICLTGLSLRKLGHKAKRRVDTAVQTMAEEREKARLQRREEEERMAALRAARAHQQEPASRADENLTRRSGIFTAAGKPEAEKPVRRGSVFGHDRERLATLGGRKKPVGWEDAYRMERPEAGESTVEGPLMFGEEKLTGIETYSQEPAGRHEQPRDAGAGAQPAADALPAQPVPVYGETPFDPDDPPFDRNAIIPGTENLGLDPQGGEGYGEQEEPDEEPDEDLVAQALEQVRSAPLRRSVVLPTRTAPQEAARELPEEELDGEEEPAAPAVSAPKQPAAAPQPEQRTDYRPLQVVQEKMYEYPPLELLDPVPANSVSTEDVRSVAKNLEEVLASFGVSAKVVNISRGPVITQYELQPAPGVRINRVTNLDRDIALHLAAPTVRIEAPIPGKNTIGIEVPNRKSAMVTLREVIGSEEFRTHKSKAAVALGKDISGHPIIMDLTKMPHLLIAGATGAGKSVCINSIIVSLLYRARPDEVQMIMIDPKRVELSGYDGIPHLKMKVVTDPHKAAGALQNALIEMTRRYQAFSDHRVKSIGPYNALAKKEGLEVFPLWVIIVDELADLMMVAPNDVEDAICRLAQLARAAGIHLVVATQRPSVDVITGLIKANVPSRIAFTTASQVDSRTILDMVGAEKLLGRGDMLYYPIGSNQPIRAQGAFVSDDEVDRITEFFQMQDTNTAFDAEFEKSVEAYEPKGAKGNKPQSSFKEDDGGVEGQDDLLGQAAWMMVDMGQASVSAIQRRFRVGYARAGRILDSLEDEGVVGPFEGSKSRKVLFTAAQCAARFGPREGEEMIIQEDETE